MLPDGSKAKKPALFMSHPRVVKIASGTDHLVCLTEDGGIYTAGKYYILSTLLGV